MSSPQPTTPIDTTSYRSRFVPPLFIASSAALIAIARSPYLVSGWGHRETNWEFSSSVQHELMQGVAVDFGYFRRIWKNFAVTDNRALAATDFTQFSMTLPTDARIPGGGGTAVTLFNVNPAKFGQSDDLQTLDSKYGKQTEHWNGFDLTLNARLQNGLTMQAGVSSGKTTEDNCEIVAALPEMNDIPGGGGRAAGLRGLEYCHREEPMLTQFKAYGVYTIPTVDVQLSGTFRSTPGAAVNGSFTATNAYLAANSTLGRALSGGASNDSVQIAPENSKFLDRRQELDVRFGKVLRFGNTRSVISLDVYNMLNNDAVLTANQNYASWLAPSAILNARVAKVSLQFEF